MKRVVYILTMAIFLGCIPSLNEVAKGNAPLPEMQKPKPPPKPKKPAPKKPPKPKTPSKPKTPPRPPHP